MKISITIILLTISFYATQSCSQVTRNEKGSIDLAMTLVSDTNLVFRDIDQITLFFSKKVDSINKLEISKSTANALESDVYDSLFYEYGFQINLCRVKYLEKNDRTSNNFRHLLYLSQDKRISVERLKNLYNSYPFEMQLSSIGKQIDLNLNGLEKKYSDKTLKRLLQYKYKNIDGVDFTISQCGKKFILVDFWASWCGPCRFENRELKKKYFKIDTSKLAIIGVSLDVDKFKWTKAIVDDGYLWMNINDFKGWDSPIVKSLDISGIPFKILLDDKGNLIKINPSFFFLCSL